MVHKLCIAPARMKRIVRVGLAIAADRAGAYGHSGREFHVDARVVFVGQTYHEGDARFALGRAADLLADG